MATYSPYRSRRIKCDEAVPACLKCKSTDRKCDGYQKPGFIFRTVIGSLDKRLPHPSSTHNPNSPEEGRALQFYRERTALKLSDHAHPDFWLRLVPQLGCSDPAVKHMMIAIASVEEALDIAENPWRCYDSCLRHHSKAIRSITRTRPSPPLEVALIFALLFSTYSNMHGRSSSAIVHVNNGLNIIREWRSSYPSSRQAPHDPSELIENQIGPIFMRLEQQILGMTPGSEQDPGVHPEPVGQPELLPFLIPRVFADFNSAQKYLRAVMSIILHSMQLYNLFPTQDLNSVRALQSRNYLAEWLQSFEACRIIQPQQPVDVSASKLCLLLEIHYRSFLIMLNTFSFQNETTFDNFEADFAFIITQARMLINVQSNDRDQNGSNGNHDRSKQFETSLGLIPPLFLTATRCRNPITRRKALSLLRTHALDRTEGIWNNKSAARIAEQVMLIEEHGVRPLRSCADVQEHKRIRLSSAEFDDLRGRLLLQYKRFPYQEHDGMCQDEIIWPIHVSEHNGVEPTEPVS